jgi:cytosine/adenosine deaminase-related metal-dependent hydrolase
MHEDVSVEAVAFNLKLLGKTPTNVLVSAGKPADKETMLPALRDLARANVRIFATPGTSRFLDRANVPNVLLHKISDDVLPNIRSFLESNRFDMVVNVLTGVTDYDEASDSKLIRYLCIEEGIPLFTEPDVALVAIRDMLAKHEAGQYRYKLSDVSEPWNLKREFLRLVTARGGFACHHAHFDKAYLISPSNLKLGQVDMQAKWKLYRYLKESYTREDLTERIERAIRKMIGQGVTKCRTFVDADATVGQLPIDVALEARERYADRIRVQIAVQPLQGVLEPETRREFEAACAKADVIGGLPSRDRPQPERHLDIVFGIAKDLDKPVDVHVDQENNPAEVETELLALKTVEHGLEGRTRAVHAISLAAHDERYQERVIALCRDAGVHFIVCPSAALSMRQRADLSAPVHNSIAPVPKLLEAGIGVSLGVDNIYDLFMPVVDGDMWFECRMLMESCRFYDLAAVADMATSEEGFASVSG